jgi:hypothetical protein
MGRTVLHHACILGDINMMADLILAGIIEYDL